MYFFVFVNVNHSVYNHILVFSTASENHLDWTVLFPTAGAWGLATGEASAASRSIADAGSAAKLYLAAV